MTRLAGIVLALTLPLAACADSQSPAVAPGASPEAAPSVAQTARPPAAAETPVRVAQATAPAPAPATDSPFREGEHYQRLTPAQPTSSSPDTVEVAEFFMYTCPHCASFEPFANRWAAKQSSDVSFIRVPVNFNKVAGLHQRAFYAAEVLGVSDDVHQAFFDEIHTRRNMMQDEKALAAFFAQHGVSEDKFTEAMSSFAVDSMTRKAQTLAARYRIRSVPTLIINGKYRTDGPMAGNYPTMLQVVDHLISLEEAPTTAPEAG